MQSDGLAKDFNSVLIVDDASIVRISARNTLRSLGIGNIEEADSVEAAWNLIVRKLESQHKIDLILCDWMMPGQDGMCLIRKIKADERFADIPVVLVTSERAEDKVLEALQVGFAGYIPKPLSLNALKNKLLSVRSLMQRKNA